MKIFNPKPQNGHERKSLRGMLDFRCALRVRCVLVNRIHLFSAFDAQLPSNNCERAEDGSKICRRTNIFYNETILAQDIDCCCGANNCAQLFVDQVGAVEEKNFF